MLNTVPASYFANVNPQVLAAGGNGLDLIGLFLTNSTRPPIGTVPAFSSALAVSSYFGSNSAEYAAAAVYFNGFDNSNIKPGSLLFAQYNQNAVAPYIRGANPGTLSTLQALSAGTLSVTLNGVVKTSSSINLSGATSFSNAAALMLAGFSNIYDAVTGAGTTIAAGTATNCTTGSITNNIFTAAGVLTGNFVVGGVLSGTNVTTGTYIVNQLTGPAGGLGTYTVSAVQNVSSTTITQSYGLMTVSTMVSGALAVGQVISGGTTTVGTTITAFVGGSGQNGTYVTSGGAQTVGATTISAGPMAITYDSISSSFVITGGTPGATGTIAYVSGTLAAGVFLTQATGAVLSQGAALATPSAFMNAVVAITTNWATFCTMFNPDVSGNANKLLFSQWNNSQGSQFIYACWDNDITPTTTVPATSSLGYLLSASQLNITGTELIYDPNNTYLAPFFAGMVASIDFTELNGNVNPTYRGQSGLAATVTNQTVLDNLKNNGYNCMVASATANNGFTFYFNGQISGPWLWAQPYINQIWLNSSFQLAMMELFVNSKSIPYNNDGDGQIHAALMDPITAALDFGAIQKGINLSASQISQVNSSAGVAIDSVLSTRGWYLQILQASPATRQARTTPPCKFWYTDGGSVQQLSLASIDLL